MQQPRRRNRFIIGVLALGLLAGLALTAPPAQAQVAGPYYVEPAWDQSLPAATRFVVLTNWGSAAVLDKETGLVWERTPDTTLQPWDDGLGAGARFDCLTRTTGGRKGWRLPSLHELASLIDPSQSNPALPLGHPFTTGATGVQSDLYWSATTLARNPAGAWFVFFGDGFVDAGVKTGTEHVWCVRGGMNADTY